jgi:hypothetical protein
MPRHEPGVERVYLKFSEPDDLALLQRLKVDAKKQRYPLQTYIMLVLLQAYPEPLKEESNV